MTTPHDEHVASKEEVEHKGFLRDMQAIATVSVFAAALIFAGAFFAAGAAVLIYLIVTRQIPGWMAAVVNQHFAAVVGLPCAALLALWIVMFLEQRAGSTLKFKALGVELQGASGQIVLWVVVFLAIVAAIRLTWNFQ